MAGKNEEQNSGAETKVGRRDFVKGIGKFAILTPPTVTMLLDVTMNSQAVAGSGGKPGWGYGDKNHWHFGPPGHNKNGGKHYSKNYARSGHSNKKKD